MNHTLSAVVLICIALTGCQKNSVRDIDGNIYKTVTIGSQVWMTTNLRTTKFNNGKPIPLVSSDDSWSSLLSPGFCWYDNDAAVYKSTYGALYNWYAVNTGNLCPIGWHLPTDEEWMTLQTNLGGRYIAGGKIKEVGKVHWNDPNTGATNETGFTAVPGGDRDDSGSFYHIGISCLWWSASEHSEESGIEWSIANKFSWLSNYVTPKSFGLSVRCLKDN